ncbi:MAG TPA: hypothetical protein PLJ37_10310 [Chitinophagales bacterium]|nr:hypothetical protein [Chitinophagales bacterium]HMY41904.1 hypothetical protein [Chitinophagales bacterium]HMZ95047.1 hypothetical protein [Chitinophagales bacterium]HNB39470.1 hypothetical protein [Chitinophagales bacterium]HNG27795.1 hypothetical protein [Chitinophagales bacterium]
MKFTIGCDPEVFLLQNGNIKSAIGLIGGNKQKPLKISEVGHYILEDNVAVEFNIPPCNSFESFANEVEFTLNELKKKLNTYDFSTESALVFPDNELNTADAWVFGCEPDYNAWTLQENEKPNCEEKNLRSAGGHIHVGSFIAQENPVETIKAMDLFLGVPSVNLDTKGKTRRQLYGNAGACRLKSYGIEYRTLSNFWIFNKSLIKWAYEGTQKALEFVYNKNSISEEDGQKIQNCINNGNMNDYEYLAKTYGL